MKTIHDALVLRNWLIGLLERAEIEEDPERRRALLTIAVAGGGFSGVETIGAINDFLREVARHYRRASAELPTLMLVESNDRLLPEFDPALGEYTASKLRAAGIDVRLRTKVAAFDGRSLVARCRDRFDDAIAAAARTMIWTAGVSPSPLIESLAIEKERGRIVVDETMAVPGHEGVWACGDCAAVPSPLGKPYPPTAQHAMRQGMQAARNIAAAVRGEPAQIRPFRYEMLGQFAAIGRHRAVATLFGMQILRLHRLADVAQRIPLDAAAPRPEGPRVPAMDARDLLRARHGATPDRGDHTLRSHRRADGQCPRGGIRGQGTAAVTDVVVVGASPAGVLGGAARRRSWRALSRLAGARTSPAVSESYALAAAGSDTGVWDWDLVAGVVYESRRARELQGLPLEPEKQSLQELEAALTLHPDDALRRSQALEAHLAGKTPHYEIEYRVRRPDGRFYWIHVRALCFRDAAGKPLRIAGSVADIDARKRAEMALRESEDRFAAAVAGSDDGLWMFDYVTGQGFASTRAQQIIGLEPGPEVLPLEAAPPGLPDSSIRTTCRDATSRCTTPSRRDPAYVGEFRVRHPAGSTAGSAPTAGASATPTASRFAWPARPATSTPASAQRSTRVRS